MPCIRFVGKDTSFFEKERAINDREIKKIDKFAIR